jgi:hypothetical protein
MFSWVIVSRQLHFHIYFLFVGYVKRKKKRMHDRRYIYEVGLDDKDGYCIHASHILSPKSGRDISDIDFSLIIGVILITMLIVQTQRKSKGLSGMV